MNCLHAGKGYACEFSGPFAKGATTANSNFGMKKKVVEVYAGSRNGREAPENRRISVSMELNEEIPTSVIENSFLSEVPYQVSP